MFNVVAAIFVVLLYLGTSVFASNGLPVTPVIEAKEVSVQPVLDGMLDDECWQGLPEYTNFMDSRTRKVVDRQTTAKICYDQKNIYIAFHATHPEPGKIRAQETKRNGSIGRDDWVGVDIDSMHLHRGVSWFDVTANGTQAESIEGGSANKIEWRGDWQAAAKTVEDGYDVEMSIPFSLLKYNKNQETFGICFLRNIPEEQVMSQWPDLNGNWDTNYFADLKGLKIPWIKPKPVMMGYMLGNMGRDGSERFYRGMDIKYPFSNDMTGLLSIKPDFSTIEQSTENINFSYTERWQSDNRPFFQESSIDTSGSMFYSRRVPDFDVGTRLVGKSGNHSYGFMSARTAGQQNDSLLSYTGSVGSRSSVHFALADHWLPGHRNTVGFCVGDLRWATGQRTHNIGAGFYSSHTTDLPDGQIKDFRYDTSGGNGALSGGFYIGRYDGDYRTELGLSPELNQQGGDVHLSWGKSLRGRNLHYLGWNISAVDWDYISGGDFRKSASVSADIEYADGHGFWTGYSRSDRNVLGELEDGNENWTLFEDRSLWFGGYWNDDVKDKNGSASVSIGRMAGDRRFTASINQRFKLSRKFVLQGGYYQEHIGSGASLDAAGTRRQMVTTLNYDLTNERSIGGRIVQQLGDRNIYLVYRQQVRVGTDAYLIFGDPNAKETTGKISFKLVRPM